MPWQIQFDAQRKVIRLTFEAEISGEEVRESSIAVIAMVHDKDTANILTDFTHAVRLGVSTASIVDLPMLYERLGLDVPFREAVVAPTGSKIRADAEFYETVCVNRGINAHVFEDLDEALKWLTW